MALWDGTPDFVMTTEQAALYARIQLTKGDAIDQGLNSHNFLRFAFGERTIGGKTIFTGKNGEDLVVNEIKFKNAVAINAPRSQISLQVGTSTGSALTVSSSTAADSTKTIDRVRTFEFANFFYEDKLTWSLLLTLFKNARNINPNEINARLLAFGEGLWASLDTQIWGTTVLAANMPTENALGQIDGILSDGLTAANRATYWTALGYSDSATGTPDETNYKQYCVDRSATGNEWARALIRRPGATMTTALVRTYARQIRDNGGSADVLWLNSTNFDQIVTEVGNPSNTGIRTDFMAEKIQKFGLKDFVIVNNDVIVAYDKSIPSTRGFFLSSESWAPGFSVLRAQQNAAPHLRAAEQTQLITGQQLLCDSPRKNMKLLIM